MALLLAFVAALQIPPVSTRFANAILGRLSPLPRSTATVGEARGNWITRLELRHLLVTRGDTVLVAADTVRVRLALVRLLTGRLPVRGLEITDLFVSSELPAKDGGEPEAPPPTLADLVHGRFYDGPAISLDRFLLQRGTYGHPDEAATSGPRVSNAHVSARSIELGGGLGFHLDSLALRYTAPGADAQPVDLRLAGSLAAGRLVVDTLSLQGGGSRVAGRASVALDVTDSTRTVEIALRADPFQLRDLRLLQAGQEYDGEVEAELFLRGPRLDRLSGTLQAELEGGHAAGFEVGPSKLEARFTDGQAEVVAVAVLEGARGEARGSLRPFDRDPSYDVEATIDRLPRRFPGAPWWEEVARRGTASARLRVVGQGYEDADLRFEGEVLGRDSRVALTGGMRLREDPQWEVERLTFQGVDPARWMGSETSSALTGSLSAEGHGGSAQSMEAEGKWVLESSHFGSWEIASGAGTVEVRDERITGALELLGDAGELRLERLTAPLAGSGPVRVAGLRFEDLDLAVVTGNAGLASALTGSLEMEGRLAAASRTPPAQRFAGTAQLVLEPSTFRARTLRRGEANAALRDGMLDLDAEVETDAGAFGASAEGRPFAETREFVVRRAQFRDLDLGAWGGMPTATRLSGTLRGRLKTVRAWSGELILEPSRIGDFDVPGGNATVSRSGERLDGHLQIQTAAGSATGEGFAVMSPDTAHGVGHVILPFGLLAALAGRDTLSSEGDLRADVVFQGERLRTVAYRADLRGQGRLGDWTVDSLFAALALEDGALTVDTLGLLSRALQASAAGRVVLSDSISGPPSDFVLRASVLEASALRSLLEADTLSLAEARLEARLTGRPPAHAFAVETHLRSLAWNDLRMIRMHGLASGTLGEDWRPEDLRGSLEFIQPRSRIVHLDSLTVTGEYGDDELAFDLDARFDDVHGTALIGTVSRDSTELRLRLTDATLRAGTQTWNLQHPTAIHLANHRLLVDSMEVRSETGYLVAHGALTRRGEQSLTVAAHEVDLDLLSGWQALEHLDGKLGGRLAVSGPASGPSADGELRIDFASGSGSAGSLESRVRWEEGEADLRAFFVSPEGDSLTAVGSLPLRLSLTNSDTLQAAPSISASAGELNLRILARAFPLGELQALLPPNAVSDIQGLLDADVRLTGREESVAARGSVHLRDAAFQLPSLGVAYRDVEVAGTLSEDRLRLSRAHARSETGELDVTGEVRFASVSRIEPNLSVHARRFLFADNRDLRLQASGDVTIGGTLSAPTVAGQITATNSSYTVTDQTFGGADASEVELTPADVRMMEEAFGYQSPPPISPAEAFYAASDLDLQISLERDNWVRKRSAPRMALEIAGNVHLRKEPNADPLLNGSLRPVPGRGYVEEFGRTFDVVGGEIQLNGPMSDHVMDVRAEYGVRSEGTLSQPDVIVHLDLHAEGRDTQLKLSSEPSMSETEILTYITTGRTPTSLPAGTDTPGSDAAALATDIGLSQVTSVLEDAAAARVGLDVLRVRYDAQLGATVMAGRYLDPRVYIGIRQPIQYRARGETNSQNPFQTSAEIEYQVLPWMSLDLQGEVSLLRFFARTRHAY